jgi:spermidine synthase
VLRLLIGLTSLFASGAGSLLAQGAIQRYVAVRSGGADAFISSAISFAFIAGIAGGAVVSGSLASRSKYPVAIWIAVELCCAAALPLFIPVFRNALDAILQHGGFEYATMGTYYAALFVLISITCGSLAALMGANYPAAYAVVASGASSSNRPAILILGSNTLGAAAGCAASVYLLPDVTLPQIIIYAAALYMLAGLLPLAVAFLERPIKADTTYETPARIAVSLGAKLLFIAGFLGFCYQVVLFRHFNLSEPAQYWVFSAVLCILLVFWALGTCASLAVRVPSLWVLAALGMSQACAAFLLLSPGGADLLRLQPWPSVDEAVRLSLLFLPVMFSGWYFGAIHIEMNRLDASQIGRVYGFNLAGTFLGGITATYALPETLGISFVFIPPLLALGSLLTALAFYLPNLNRGWRYAGISVCLLLIASTTIAPISSLRDSYYLSITRRMAPAQTVEVQEDWGTSAWLADDNYIVGGRMQSPAASNPCGGYRTQQMLVPVMLKKNSRIFYVGIGAGISNGALGLLLPAATIQSVDYSRAVGKLWSSHPRLSFDLLHQTNNHARIMDGRLALTLNSGKYNIIQEYAEAEGIRGISTIKSIEFLRMVKAHLEEDGVFAAVGFSSSYAATIQKVFRNVWVFADIPIFIATDRDLTEMFNGAAPAGATGKIACIDTVLHEEGEHQLLTLLPNLNDAIVTDEYPLADYLMKLRTIDSRQLDGRPTMRLPFLAANLIEKINTAKLTSSALAK